MTKDFWGMVKESEEGWDRVSQFSKEWVGMQIGRLEGEMTDPSPDDIVDKLFEAAYTAGKRRKLESGPVKAAIQKAILAERERCAKLTEGMWHASHKDIAAAIRKDPS